MQVTATGEIKHSSSGHCLDEDSNNEHQVAFASFHTFALLCSSFEAFPCSEPSSNRPPGGALLLHRCGLAEMGHGGPTFILFHSHRSIITITNILFIPIILGSVTPGGFHHSEQGLREVPGHPVSPWKSLAWHPLMPRNCPDGCESGSNVWTYDCYGGNNQQWTFTENP